MDASRRNETNMSRAAYEIRAVGSVPPDVLEDFAGITVTYQPAGSTIRADLADEAELHGVLDALRRGGFELIEMHRAPPFDPADPDAADVSRADDPDSEA